jgi:XRE family transcriptional regulator, regulator of sulfur utilization
MVTRRDLVVAAAGFAAALCVVAMAETASSTLHSAAFAWDAVPEKATEVGSVRSYFRSPTATLNELEYHATTLKPGLASHPPHRHPNEEIVIIKEGTVEALVSGKWQRLGAGALIFNASNELHGLRNVGDKPATYHVINWSSTQTPPAEKK